jgi:tetratricopeptide (TPR) repeat protein
MNPTRGIARGARPRSVSMAIVGLALALVLLCAAVFAPVRHFGFVEWDDPLYVTENPRVMAGLTWPGVAWALTTSHEFYWQPLTWMSHMLDVELYGLNAGGHHVTSLVIHTATTLLLFGVLRRMTGAVGRSAFVAALFAVHPLHVESVAWVAERKDVLSAFFLVLALWAYVRYVERPAAARYLAVVACYVLGLMSKPMVVTLPVVLLLVDVWPLRRFSRARAGGLVIEKAPFFLLAAASAAATVIGQVNANAMRDLGSFPIGLRAANAVISYATYIVKMAWPSGLAAFYPHPTAMPPWWLVAGAGVILAGLPVGAFAIVRRQPYVLAGWLWYVVTLLPVIGLVLVGDQARADRFTYIPLIGLFIIVAWGIPDLMPRRPGREAVLAVAAGAAVLAFAAAARVQVGYWESNLSLWTRAAAVTRDNQRAHASLGIELSRSGHLDEAAAQFQEALRIVPTAADLHNYLAEVRERQGRVDDALEGYSTAVRLKADYERARRNLATLLERQGRMADAIAVWEGTVRLAPRSAAARNSLGVALAGAGRLEDGIRELQESVRLDPGYARARVNLGVALEQQGRISEAAAEYAAATHLQPDYALAFHNLGVALARLGRAGEAIQAATTAVRLEPSNADWRTDLAIMLASSGDAAAAIQHLEQALAINPAHATARRALADLRRQTGR